MEQEIPVPGGTVHTELLCALRQQPEASEPACPSDAGLWRDTGPELLMAPFVGSLFSKSYWYISGPMPGK